MPVTDTSVVMKWLFREQGSPQALVLLESQSQFYAPDYLEIEILSGITKKVRSGLCEIRESHLKLEQFHKLPVQLIPLHVMREFAFERASVYPITFYDALFLAAAINLNDYLLPADEKLIVKLESMPDTTNVYPCI